MYGKVGRSRIGPLAVPASVALAVLVTACALAPPARAGVDVDFGANVMVGDDAELFVRISSRNYDRDPDEVRAFSRAFPASDDLNVALHLARYCDRGPEFFLALRKSGVGWFEISRRCAVPVDVWFVPVERDPGPPYGKAYGHWKKHRNDRNVKVVLTDREARDLVAVRFIHEYYGVPVETAMSWRARGADVRKLVVTEYDRRHGKDKRGAGGAAEAARAKPDRQPGKGHGKAKGSGPVRGRA